MCHFEKDHFGKLVILKMCHYGNELMRKMGHLIKVIDFEVTDFGKSPFLEVTKVAELPILRLIDFEVFNFPK